MNLPDGWAVCVMDFAKNRQIWYQDEIKEAHWSKKQVSMHPTVIYYKSSDNPQPLRLVITHFSDIVDHSADVVEAITADILKILKERFPEHCYKFFYKDGCSSQYKGKYTFYHVSTSPNVERAYFGSEHGKSESDAKTSTINYVLNKGIISRKTIITGAADMYNFLVSRLEASENDIFRVIEKDDVEKVKPRHTDIRTLTGNCTRKMHQIKPASPPQVGVLYIRAFACYCDICLSGEPSKCSNIDISRGEFLKQTLPGVVSSKIVCAQVDHPHEGTNESDPNDLSETHNDNTALEHKSSEDWVLADSKETVKVDVNDYIVVKHHINNKTLRYVAKVIRVGKQPLINYMKRSGESGMCFRESENPNDIGKYVDPSEIVMCLPAPAIHRGTFKFLFCLHVNN